jgi:hypothetical protein
MNEQTDGAEAQPGPETDLRATVWALADADDALTEDAKLALLEALGDDAPSAPATDGSVSDGNPVYLKSIGVKGFRGVGPEVRIPLKAGPGLVVISGRNGSGKSTVAEALELALTGRSYRWHNRTAVWSHGGRPDLRVQSLHLLHQRGFRDQSTGRFGINCMASPLSVSHCGGNRVPVLPGKGDLALRCTAAPRPGSRGHAVRRPSLPTSGRASRSDRRSCSDRPRSRERARALDP